MYFLYWSTMESPWSLERWLQHLVDTWPEGASKVTIPSDSEAGRWMISCGLEGDDSRLTLTRSKAKFFLKIADQLKNAP